MGRRWNWLATWRQWESDWTCMRCEMSRHRLLEARPAGGGQTWHALRVLATRALGPAALLAVVLVSSVGCASMHHGRTQHVIVTSEPPGAQIFANDEPVGVTPDVVSVNRGGTVLRLEKSGFHSEEVRMPRGPSAWLAGSLLLAAPFVVAGSYWLSGAILTIVTDLGTGAAWKFPERAGAALEPAAEVAAHALVGVNGEVEVEP